MPLLFYFPMIIWAGLIGVAHDARRPPPNVKARR